MAINQPVSIVLSNTDLNIAIADDGNSKFIQQIVVEDSLFSTFPTCKIDLQDHSSYFLENMGFIEGSTIRVRLEDTISGYLMDHEFSLREMDGSLMHTYRTLNESLEIYLISKTFINNYRKSKSFVKPLNIVATEIAVANSLTAETSPCNNKFPFYQSQIGDFDFLENHSKVAYNISQKNSPFIHFVSLSGTLYFCTLQKLFLQRELPIVFNREISEVYEGDPTYIQSLESTYLGLDTNLKNYNQIHLAYNGEKNLTIETDIELSNTNKFRNDRNSIKGVIKNNIGTKLKNFKSQKNREVHKYGIYDETDVENFQGFSNFKNINSFLPTRITIGIKLNLSATSGKIVKLKFPSSNNQDLDSRFTAYWLIVGSKHIISNDLTTNDNYTILVLARHGFSDIDLNPTIRSLLA